MSIHGADPVRVRSWASVRVSRFGRRVLAVRLTYAFAKTPFGGADDSSAISNGSAWCGRVSISSRDARPRECPCSTVSRFSSCGGDYGAGPTRNGNGGGQRVGRSRPSFLGHPAFARTTVGGGRLPADSRLRAPPRAGPFPSQPGSLRHVPHAHAPYVSARVPRVTATRIAPRPTASIRIPALRGRVAAAHRGAPPRAGSESKPTS